MEDYYDFLNNVLLRPRMWIGIPTLNNLEVWNIGYCNGANLNFDEMKLPLHRFLNNHFKVQVGSQVFWTHILEIGMPNAADEDRIKYLQNLMPTFAAWRVMEI